MSGRLTHTTRREALAGLAAVSLAGCSRSDTRPEPSASSTSPSSLTGLAGRKGRRFGSAIAWNEKGERGSIQNAAYTAVVKAECGLVVPENELKWQFTRKDPKSFDFSRMDDIVKWAQGAGLAIRGHTLLWNRPRWFPNGSTSTISAPAGFGGRAAADHAYPHVTERYRGVITSYDVVNETIDHDTHGLIETSLSRAMGSGEAVLDLAFHTARDQLPDAQLVYNDYMSWEPQHDKHRADVLRLLEGFRRRNVPVDALGIQSHIEILALDPATGLGPYQEREWRKFLDDVVAMGYKLLVTEFDVKDKALASDVATRDAKVAEYSKRYFDVMLDYDELGDILAWGMVDKFSWLQGFSPRNDKLEVRCCPYDSGYQPKPLRAAIAESLTAA
jgi:endo-1,4-beta-xylanase